MDHFIFVETQKPSARHRGAEGSGQSGGVETAFLQRISRGDADATHDLTGRYEGGQESFPVRLLHFARSKGREKCSCARVYASTGLTDVVQLKGMSHGSVGECCQMRRHPPVFSKNRGTTREAEVFNKLNHLLTPRLGGTVKSHCDDVQETVFGPGNHLRRDITVTKSDGVVGELSCRAFGHRIPSSKGATAFSSNNQNPAWSLHS